jgi:uncharacterized RDD family membrane protein YckC
MNPPAFSPSKLEAKILTAVFAYQLAALVLSLLLLMALPPALSWMAMLVALSAVGSDAASRPFPVLQTQILARR